MKKDVEKVIAAWNEIVEEALLNSGCLCR